MGQDLRLRSFVDVQVLAAVRSLCDESPGASFRTTIVKYDNLFVELSSHQIEGVERIDWHLVYLRCAGGAVVRGQMFPS